MKYLRGSIISFLCSAILPSSDYFGKRGRVSAFVAPSETNKRTSPPQPSDSKTHYFASKEEEFCIFTQPDSRREIVARAAGGLAVTMLTLLNNPTAGIAAAAPSKVCFCLAEEKLRN